MKQGYDILQERKARRFYGRLGVMVQEGADLRFGVLTSLSRHGAFLEMQAPPRLGSSVSFVLSNGRTQATLTAHVVRLFEAHAGKAPGVGLVFEPLDDMAKRLRDDVILYWMLQTFTPFAQSDAAVT